MSPPILSTLCYVRSATHTLMLHRVKKTADMHEGKWNGLGGKFLPGESPDECVVREVQEESGLLLQAPNLRGFMTFPGFDGENDWYVFLYTAEKFSGSLIESPEGDLKWVEHQRLLELNLWEGDRVFLPWLDRPGFFSATFRYQQKKLIEHSVNWHGLPPGPADEES
jgi:8-oxo-dGTP diphosphatase